MKLKCPNCGHGARLLDFANEEASRQAVYLVADVPKSLGRLMLQYIGLFRPASRSLSWDRTLKLMQQLKADIDAAQIERHSRIWHAPEEVWLNAFNVVLAKANTQTLTLPLKNHGYLYEIICSAQSSVEAKQEQEVEAKRQQQTRIKTGRPAKPFEITEDDKQAGSDAMRKAFKTLKIKKKTKA